jgi:hypothetical protein
MGQCQTTLNIRSVLPTSEPIPAGIRVEPVNPPTKRIKRTRSRIIYEGIIKK